MTAPRAATAAPGSIALQGGGARVEVVPAHGGRVRSLVLGGREWLLRDPDHAEARLQAPPLEGAGWDECAPAAGGGVVPEWVKGIGGRPVPPGGEARRQVPEIAVRTGADGHAVECTWRGERLPWTLHRTLVVRPDGTVEARYEALNTGTHRLPFLWSAHLLLALDAGTRLQFPGAGRFRLASLVGVEGSASKSGDAATWPRLLLDGKPRDLGAPWTVPRRALLQGWVDLPHGRSAIHVIQGDRRLVVTTDGEGIPHCGLTIDRGGLRRGRRRAFSRALPPSLALHPALGAPDRIADALGDWQSVTWLAPGEPRRWSLILRVPT
jgi:galactose mutarotase-like enzyme